MDPLHPRFEEGSGQLLEAAVRREAPVVQGDRASSAGQPIAARRRGSGTAGGCQRGGQLWTATTRGRP